MVYSSSGKVLSWVSHHRKDAILGITSQNKVRTSAAGRQAEQSCAGDHQSTNRNRFANIFSHHWRAAAAESLQSCLTLCDPIDASPPGSAVPGILQARTLEWVAISSSNAWKRKVKVKSVMSGSSRPHGLQPTRLLCPWEFPGKSTGVGCQCLLQFEGCFYFFDSVMSFTVLFLHLDLWSTLN